MGDKEKEVKSEWNKCRKETTACNKLEDDSINLSSKNIPTNQAMNSDKNGGDKLYTILYTSGSTGLPKVDLKVL